MTIISSILSLNNAGVSSNWKEQSRIVSILHGTLKLDGDLWQDGPGTLATKLFSIEE